MKKGNSVWFRAVHLNIGPICRVAAAVGDFITIIIGSEYRAMVIDERALLPENLR